MADRNYDLEYNVTGNAPAVLLQVSAQVVQLDGQVAALAAQFKALNSQLAATARHLASLAKAGVTAAAAAGNLSAQASAAQKSVGGVGSAAAAATPQLNGARAAANANARAATAAAAAYVNAAQAIGVAGAAAAAATPQLNGARAATNGVRAGANGAAAGLGNFTSAVVALQAGRAGFRLLLDESEKLEDFWQKLAAEATAFRASLREQASIVGEAGPNRKVVARNLDVALAARISAEKAESLITSYENFGLAVREKGHIAPAAGTPADLEASILAEVGRAANRLGIEPGIAGEAVGTAGLFHKFTSTEDAMQQFGAAAQGLQEGKVRYNEGFSALSKLSAKLVDPKELDASKAKAGRIESFAEAGIYLGALSLGTATADQAQHRAVQISRALNPSSANPKGQAALKAVGITDDMQDEDKLIRLSEYLRQNHVADATEWMVKNNVAMRSDALKESVNAGMKAADVLKAQLGRHREETRRDPAGVGKRFIEANRQFMATDEASEAAGVESSADVLNKAEGEENRRFETAKQQAELRMRLSDPAYFHSPWRGIHAMVASPATYLLAGVKGAGYRQELDPEHGAIPYLVKEGKFYGLDLEVKYPGLYSNNYRERARAFQAASEEVAAAGGDPLGLKETEAATKARVGALGAGPGAAGAAPAVPAARPGGAAPAPPGRRPAAGAVGAVGAAPAGAPVAMADGALLDLNRRQADALDRIDGKLAGGGGAGAAVGPMPADGGDFGGRRAGG